jgi:protein-tyrosine phosphatase
VDFSPITDSLIIGTTPEPGDYDTLRALGVRLVINMRAEQPPIPDPHTAPVSILWLRTHDFPLLPIPIRALRRGAQAALETIAQGGKVYAHCAAGVHRSAAMGAAILIAQDHSAEDAIQLIKRRRPIADPDAWYIRWRINRFAANWTNHR